jgi:hypothetical protein
LGAASLIVEDSKHHDSWRRLNSNFGIRGEGCHFPERPLFSPEDWQKYDWQKKSDPANANTVRSPFFATIRMSQH